MSRTEQWWQRLKRGGNKKIVRLELRKDRGGGAYGLRVWHCWELRKNRRQSHFESQKFIYLPFLGICTRERVRLWIGVGAPSLVETIERFRTPRLP